MGANANASTTDDFTMFFMTIRQGKSGKGDRARKRSVPKPELRKPAFQTEAGAVYGEYRKDITNPFFLLEEKLTDRAYDVHTYKHTTMGFEADIKAMPEDYDYSLSFFKRFYRPENVVILVVGDVERKPFSP